MFNDMMKQNASIMEAYRKMHEKTPVVEVSPDPEIGDSVLQERKLSPEELDKREEVAQAIEKKHPEMDMGKKMAIATSVAKKVAEEKLVEGEDRSEYSAHRALQNTPGTAPIQGKYKLKRGIEPISGHDSMEDAVKAWRQLPDQKGVKIIQESDEGVLLEEYDPNATGIQSVFTLYDKNFGTKAFMDAEKANAFMQTPEGKNFGYLGKCDEGMYHCARMDDQGTPHTPLKQGD